MRIIKNRDTKIPEVLKPGSWVCSIKSRDVYLSSSTIWTWESDQKIEISNIIANHEKIKNLKFFQPSRSNNEKVETDYFVLISKSKNRKLFSSNIIGGSNFKLVYVAIYSRDVRYPKGYGKNKKYPFKTPTPHPRVKRLLANKVLTFNLSTCLDQENTITE